MAEPNEAASRLRSMQGGSKFLSELLDEALDVEYRAGAAEERERIRRELRTVTLRDGRVIYPADAVQALLDAGQREEVKTFCSTCRHARSQHTDGIGPCVHCNVKCPRFSDLPDTRLAIAAAYEKEPK